MKRILYILCMTLVFAGCDTSDLRPPTSDLYQRYASRQNLTVAQVTGFHLNDTVKTDVVILVADDSVPTTRSSA